MMETMETRCFTAQQRLLISIGHGRTATWRVDASSLGPTHQLPLLHALHHHLQDLLRLAFAVVERLLDGDQQLLPHVVVHQAAGGQWQEAILASQRSHVS